VTSRRLTLFDRSFFRIGRLLFAALLGQLRLPQATVEAVDATFRVYDTLLAGKERMTR
jgi:hypothetical protein